VPGTFDHADSRGDVVDPDAEESAAFLAAVETRFGLEAWTAKDVTNAMYDPASVGLDGRITGLMKPGHTAADVVAGVQLAEAYPTVARGKHWRPGSPYTELTKPLGYWLRHREGQWFDGRRVEKASRGRGGAEYRIVREQGPGGAP